MIMKNELIKHKRFIFLKNEMNLNQRKLYNFFIDQINDYYKELNGDISLIDWNKQFEYDLKDLKKITESTNYAILIKSLEFFRKMIVESKIIDIEKKNTIEEYMVLIQKTIIDKKENKVFVKFGNDVLKIPFEEKGFIKIDIDTMVLLRGKHTLTIYEILKSYDYGKRNIPVISLDDLKELLGLNEGYRNNLIRPQIIIPAIKEIEKHTTLRIKYKMLKEGREISHIKFNFFNNSDKLISQSNEIELLNKVISKMSESDRSEVSALVELRNRLIRRSKMSIKESELYKGTEELEEIEDGEIIL
jgi:plasmid replication initiation protein